MADTQAEEGFARCAAPRVRGSLRLVGHSSALVQLRRWITAVAPLASHVLLTGETGTGKGLVARLLHEHSPRCAAPWVHVDCAALAPSVIESELFGHERGAFTGAERVRRGCFEAAADGTLFLDEVAELDLPLQAKLLRVLENREFERVGGRVTIAARARVVAATNRNLEREVRGGRFREDLFYRLHVASYRLPPLRERLEDLPLLVAHQLRAIAAQRGVPVSSLDPQDLRLLAEHRWPGNVRELANVLERWAILDALGDGTQRSVEHVLRGSPSANGLLPNGTSAAPIGFPAAPSAAAERDRLLAVLVAAGGNVARAARRLAIPRSTLRYRIDRYQLRDLLPRD